METELVTEVPSSLKQLARLVVRGFFSIEDALIIDMLVRNPCMKEDDICDLLKFEKKMLRAKLTTLKNDKFIQGRLKMETGIDGKAQKVNYYFINYKIFVNMVKYRLDHMRKRMETEERDATSRASFKCPSCLKTFTDLEADQLFDPTTQEFCCTFCGAAVEEDQCAAQARDSKVLLAAFNQQMGRLYELLQRVEDIKLAPEVLEPEPTDISALRGEDYQNRSQMKPSGEHSGSWSGEASRRHGFQVDETRVDVTIGDETVNTAPEVRKERPIWMVESTVVSNSMLPQTEAVPQTTGGEITSSEKSKTQEDIMSVLLAHEKKGAGIQKPVIPGQSDSGSDSSDVEMEDVATIPTNEGEGVMESEDEDQIPTVSIGDQQVPVTEVTDKLIAKMTPSEKEEYITVYQEYFSSMYD